MVDRAVTAAARFSRTVTMSLIWLGKAGEMPDVEYLDISTTGGAPFEHEEDTLAPDPFTPGVERGERIELTVQQRVWLESQGYDFAARMLPLTGSFLKHQLRSVVSTARFS